VRRFCVLLVAAAAAVSSACNGSSPSSPSGAGASGSTSGAVITGAIVAPSGSSAAGSTLGTTAATIPGLTVSVVGTSISSAVNAANRFSLSGVPGGDVQLQFTAPGLNAGLGMPGVRNDERIAVTVSLIGSTAVLESQARSSGSEEQLEGRVESLPPTVAPLTLVVAGRTVTTNATTQFFLGGSSATFSSLAIGQRVHVKGTTSGPALAASVVQIQNTNVDVPVEINGTVLGFSGTPASFQFTIDGRLIMGDATTEFFGNSVFTNLANGRRAEVKGVQRNGFVFATRIHVNVDDVSPTPNPESSSIEGLLTSLGGAPPTLTLVVAGTTVTTNAATEVKRKGDVQSLGVLALNMTVHVVGTRQADGSLVARMIQIKEDSVGGAFEISGSAGGVKGSCPALTFGVNGYDVVTDAATVFVPACAGLKSGNKVTVRGIVQPGGSIKATSVVKQ